MVSNQKKSTSKGLKNVLSNPQSKFWPVLKEHQITHLEKLLTTVLPVLRRPSERIPWSQLRQLKREERAKVKKEAIKGDEIPEENIITSVITGINAVTRALEKANVGCVLLDANIDPPLLVKHIVMMAQNNFIPILLIPGLKNILNNNIGFSSAAFALKKSVVEDSNQHFHTLYEEILNMSKEYPIPKNLINTLHDVTQTEDPILPIEIIPNKSVTIEPFVLSTTVYKYRSTCNERAFIPLIKRNKSKEHKMNEDESTDERDESTEKEKMKSKMIGNEFLKRNSDITYSPLKVKRLKANGKRTKATKLSKSKKRFYE